MHPVKPSLHIGGVLGEVVVAPLSHIIQNGILPLKKRNVDKAVLVPDNILFPFQVLVQNGGDTLYFVPVAFNSGRNLFRVVFPEPSSLTVVWALPRHLEVKPLLGIVVLSSKRGKAELIFLVVLFDEVFEDGTGLPDRDACVGVDESGETAVGVDLFKLRCLQVGVRDDGGLIWKIKFPQEHDHLPGVGAGTTTVEIERLDLRTHGEKFK